MFLDPLFKGCYPDDVLDDMAEAGLGENIQEGDLEIIGERLDFLGDVAEWTGDRINDAVDCDQLS